MSSSAPTSSSGTAAALRSVSSSQTPATPGGGERPAPRRSDTADSDGLNPTIPTDAPPSYDSAMSSGDLTVASGPARMDFSGPPPMPDHIQQQYQQQQQQYQQQPLEHTPTGGLILPGVGVGYGGRTQGGAGGSDEGWRAYPGQTPGYAPPPQHPNGAHFPGHYPSPTGRPPPPPNSTRPQPTATQDNTPTETPVPGRPLLHGGQLLVYPKGHFCSKCSNTGYKNADPNNPCTTDWRKYGKDFNSALAHSYAIAPRPGSNGTTIQALNFQRPLPALQPPVARPPPPMQQHYRPAVPMRPQPNVQYSAYGAPVPRGALYVKPGDPRIGGRLCNVCGGTGTEMNFNFFFFDETRCRACNGIGRIL